MADSGLLDSLPVTEQSNDLSSNVDLLSSEEFIRIARQVDAQLFAGWKQYPGLLDSRTIQTLTVAAQKVAEVLHDPSNSVVVLSGCGTSGRVAYLTARTINRLLERRGLVPCVRYTISGGDRALICSDELPEDDPIAGQQDLQLLVKDKTKVVFVGISCGISAPYVAGQIDFCMRQPTSIYTTIIMGFNPLSCVRNVPIELWQGRSFYDVVTDFVKLQEQQLQSLKLSDEQKVSAENLQSSYLVLNPLVGPELITGSSRMKGGSITKILLDLMFSSSFQQTFTDIRATTLHEKIAQIISTWQSVYHSPSNLASIITRAGDCLLNNGRLFYVGDQVMGLMGLIDASEMPDTFGQPHSRIRAFVRGGWHSVGAQTGDLAERFGGAEPLFLISLDDFSREIAPSLCSTDIVIVCSNESRFELLPPDLQRCWTEALSRGAHVASIAVRENSKHRVEHKDLQAEVIVASSSLVEGDFALSTLAMKWMLNSVTTGANVRAGLVVGNDMVNVTVANDKIYRRAVRIVAQHSLTSLQVAEEALLRVIYQTDDASAHLAIPVSQHCIRATKLFETRVVPQAIVLAFAGCSLQEAAHILSGQPSVRLALRNVQKNKLLKTGREKEKSNSQSSML